MDGSLEKDLRETYGKTPSLKQFNQIDLNDPRVKEAIDNGYTIEEIQAYLRK